MKKSVSFLSSFMIGLIILIGLNVTAQNYDYDFQDGRIYLKFNDNITVPFEVNPDHTVELENAAFLIH